VKTAMTVLAVVLGLLSIAAGAAKVALVPEEVAFLQQFHFTNAFVVIFGMTQALGGVGLVVPRTRFFAALICAAGFMLSAGLLLATGNLPFGGISLLPVALAVLVAYRIFVDRRISGQPR